MKKFFSLPLFISLLFADVSINKDLVLVEEEEKSMIMQERGEDTLSSFLGLSFFSFSSDFQDGVSQQDMSMGVRYGLQSNNWRSFIELAGDWRGYAAMTFETDKIFTLYRFNNIILAPYFGLSLGYYTHTRNDENHAILGLHTGMILNLSEHVDMDIGYSYKEKQNDNILNQVEGFSLAVHYFF